MQKDRKKIAMALAIGALVALSAIVPYLVRGAEGISDDETAEPTYWPNVTYGESVPDLNTTSDILIINNTAYGTINGNSSEASGNKWIVIRLRNMDNASGSIVLYNGNAKIWARIPEDASTWYDCGVTDYYGNVTINDSDWDYSFDTGDTMEIKIQLMWDTVDIPVGDYTTIGTEEQNWPSWKIIGYS